ncbi:bis-tetraphosphatase [Aspergillus ambiguus]|uniref:putative bis(5'-nucleosyl)-tetraphosphatase n=1 Tax=Aspergillus ambiguus TaxID=176160 RepID=UPI003CCCA568
MQLGLPDSLPALVARRFLAAKDAGHLLFSQTHLTTINVAGIPYQLRYCPALAKKPSGAPKPDNKGPKPDPFQDPSPDLLIARIPRDNPSHILVLNKFPVIHNHFILATKDWKPQTDLLDKEDLDAAYACVRAWDDSTAPQPKRLFAFFNSGDESGASQPHRHLQFLPVEDMQQGGSPTWQPLIEAVASSSAADGESYRRLGHVPFAHFALPIPPNPSADTLHRIYLSLYRAALAAASVDSDHHAHRTTGPAAVSYNLGMTTSTMMICPRKSESARVPVDSAASQEVVEAGLVSLNGTLLAGTLMVKAEAEWDELRRNPESLADVLATIGFAHPDLRENSVL